LLVHLFAWKLLVFSGYRPELKRCLRCRRRSAVGAVKLHTQRGGTIHRSCLGADGAPSLAVSLPALKGLSYMAEAPIADALRLRGTAAAFAEMAAAIASLVEARFEQPFDFPAGPTP
jgi:recombinational DNA repair protein (RecF pathway)